MAFTTQPRTWRRFVLLCLFLIFVTKPKRNPPLLPYPPIFFDSLPCACCIVAKLLRACHILGKRIDATSYFQNFINNPSLHSFVVPHHPHLVANITPLPKGVIVFNDKNQESQLYIMFHFPSCLINMIMLPFYQHLIPYFILMLAYFSFQNLFRFC